MLFVQVTPTYFRKSQLVDLHRMAHVLYIASLKVSHIYIVLYRATLAGDMRLILIRLQLNILWVLVEDSEQRTDQGRLDVPLNSKHDLLTVVLLVITPSEDNQRLVL